jgi:tetratricopeptide (TPR) repeat protein
MIDPAPLQTSSVQAFKAYYTAFNLPGHPIQSVAMLERATQLDPNFADAWSALDLFERNLGETQRANENLKRAFALRSRVSESHKQWIEARYYLNVTGEVYKAIDAFRSWENLEPNH